MLTLDPTLPLIWITPTSVRFGAQRAVATLDDVDDELAALLERMRRGVVPAEPRVVLGAARAEAVLERLAPALISATRPRLRLEVTGVGPVAGTVRSVLGDDGHALRRRDVDVSIPIADWRLPDLERQRLLGRDRVHLPVVVGDQRIVIGPWTVPGEGACPRCAQLTDPDAAVPLGLPPIAAVPASAVAQAVGHVALLVNRAARSRAEAGVGATVDLADGELTIVRWDPHPDCGCAEAAGRPPSYRRDDAGGRESSARNRDGARATRPVPVA